MHDLILLVLGALIGGAGHLVLRRLRRDHVSEALSRADQTLSVHEKMQRQGKTPEDLQAIEDAVVARRQVRRSIEDRLTEEMPTDPGEDDPTAFMPQQTMNIWQAHRAQEMNAKLQGVIVELQVHFSESERDQFEKAQKAWEKYRAAEAEFASLEMEGGSAQPLLRWGAHTRLTIERIASLKEEAVRRRKLAEEIEGLDR